MARESTSKIVVFAMASLVALSAIGCQSGYRSYAKKLTTELAQGKYVETATYCGTEVASLQEDDADMVIYLLEAGRTAQIAGEIENSLRWYSDVQERLRPYLDTEAEAKASEAVATTAVNQTIALYKGTPSDRMLASALNSVNLMKLGQFDSARVELNRAAEWQQDAVNRFQAEIDKELAKTQESAQGTKGEDGKEAEPQVAVSSEKLDQQLKSEQFQNLANLTAYANFANPFVDHLRGVFYLAMSGDPGDLDTARFSFRQVASMVEEAGSMVAPDLKAIDESSRRRPSPTTWVYFMTGLGPRLEEFRVDVPIPVGNVNYVSAAFPYIKFDDNFEATFTVTGSGIESSSAVTLADMDRIVASEFRDRLPLIITQEIISAAVKAAATYGLQAGLGSYGQIAGILYQAASTAADLRMWRSIPKKILLCRVSTPPDGLISVSSSPSRTPHEVQVQPGVSNIVVFTLPAANTTTPSVLSIPLDRSTQASAASTN